MFGAASAAPATPAFGGFGAAASTPAATPGLFGAAAAATPGFGTTQPAATPGGSGLFGASAAGSTPAAGGAGGLFGAASPAPAAAAGAGGLFGASAAASSPAGGLSFGGGLGAPSAATTTPSLFGAASAGAGAGGGLFGASTGGGGLFGASTGGVAAGTTTPGLGGGGFGSSLFGGGAANQPAGGGGNQLALVGQQPSAAGPVLSTIDGQPVKHYTQWNELSPQSQQYLLQLEKIIVEHREDSKLLDGVARLREHPDAPGQKERRELERDVLRASRALKLIETQLWSDDDRLQTLKDAVRGTFRDAEHALARTRRLRAAMRADDEARAHGAIHPGQPPPAGAAPVYLPPPTHPSPFLMKTVDRLYAQAEGFERGTLELEHNLRTTGRVLGDGVGGGPGLEALAVALHGGDASGAGGDLELVGFERGDDLKRPKPLAPDAGPREARSIFTPVPVRPRRRGERRSLRTLSPGARFSPPSTLAHNPDTPRRAFQLRF